ncbi:hypothetical protein ACROYT_G003103 [Oculina patagonica]
MASRSCPILAGLASQNTVSLHCVRQLPPSPPHIIRQVYKLAEAFPDPFDRRGQTIVILELQERQTIGEGMFNYNFSGSGKSSPMWLELHFAKGMTNAAWLSTMTDKTKKIFQQRLLKKYELLPFKVLFIPEIFADLN